MFLVGQSRVRSRILIATLRTTAVECELEQQNSTQGVIRGGGAPCPLLPLPRKPHFLPRTPGFPHALRVMQSYLWKRVIDYFQLIASHCTRYLEWNENFV